MKTLFISIAVCSFLSFNCIAQKQVTIEYKDIVFTHGKIPGFVVTIPEVTEKKITEEWIKRQQKGTKSPVQTDAGELSIFGALFKSIVLGPINVYSYIRNKDSINQLYVSIELKPKEYITKEGRIDEYNKAREFLLNFAKDQYLDLANGQLKIEERKLKKKENELESLEAEKTKLEKTIKSNEVNISSINAELVITRNNLKTLNDELLSQNSQYNTMAEGPTKVEKKKYIADLEKRIKKSNKEIERSEKKIIDLKEEANKAQNDGIPNNLKEQQKIKNELDQQKEVVRIATEKCNKIKAFQ